MSTHKYIDRICAVVTAFALLLTLLFLNGEALGLQNAERTMGYESRLFDTSKVHTIDIVMEDWDGFIANCENEEYVVCSVVIDGEAYKNIGIRAKGNTSLSSVSSMNSDRYSFKIEFDQYDSTIGYHGLDKLSLNNLIQDATMMKDYLTYQMMGKFGVAAPLCSYAYLTVNGEDWGLYLAVEAIEDSFLQRNYGSDYGELYKPDSMNFGGGRGNGKNFNMEDFDFSEPGSDRPSGVDSAQAPQSGGNAENRWNRGNQNQQRPGNFDPSSLFDQGNMELPEDFDPSTVSGGTLPTENFDPSSLFGGSGGTEPPAGESVEPPGDFDVSSLFGGKGDMGGFGGMGGAETKLQYIDDDPDSYSAIFDSAKTEISDADQARLIEALKILSSGENIRSAVDVDAVLRYFVVHNFVVNGDSYTGSMIHNYYLYEKDGQLSMLPWDYNLAFGTFQGGSAQSTVNDPIDTPLSVTGSGDRPMADWIFSDEEYTALYHQYFAEFLNSVDVLQIIDETSELIAPYVEQDPTKFYSYEEFEAGVVVLREFCALRTESIQLQLDGTIPSTDSGQSADGAALVDASHLTLSDMGSMGMGGGKGGFPGGENFDRGEGGDRNGVPGGMTVPSDKAFAVPDATTSPSGTRPF